MFKLFVNGQYHSTLPVGTKSKDAELIARNKSKLFGSSCIVQLRREDVISEYWNGYRNNEMREDL